MRTCPWLVRNVQAGLGRERSVVSGRSGISVELLRAMSTVLSVLREFLLGR
jgi:hypothetical protein